MFNIYLSVALKTIESYKLEALIIEDLKYNGNSSMDEIKERLKEISGKDIQKSVYKLSLENKIMKEGGTKNRRYFIVKKKQIKNKLKIRTNPNFHNINIL